jgi:RNA polymerase subunit RPABC4/transcription elongation factor Spt4
MAIIACYECGAQISNTALKCPRCGAAKKTLIAAQRIWLIVIVGGLAAVLLEMWLSS